MSIKQYVITFLVSLGVGLSVYLMAKEVLKPNENKKERKVRTLIIDCEGVVIKTIEGSTGYQIGDTLSL